MPEGHTIHRAARLQRRRFAGEVLEVDSPQGRFADGAAELSGRRLEGVDALGKHLFHRWEGDLTVHIHLGLFGKFKVFSDVSSAPEPTDGTRMRWRGDAGVMHLSGPTACEIIDGDPDRIGILTDLWTYARDVRSRDPNWELVATRVPED